MQEESVLGINYRMSEVSKMIQNADSWNTGVQ